MFGAASVGAYFLLFKKPLQQQSIDLTPPINVFVTKFEDVQKSGVFPAKVVPKKVISILSEANGIIVKKYFENGNYIKAGDLIYELASSSFELIANANYENLKNQKSLFEEKLNNNEISQIEYEKFVKSLQEAEKESKIVQRGSSKIKIFAPISGFLSDSNATIGMQVSVGHSLGKIIETSTLYIDVAISSNLFEKTTSNNLIVKIIKDEKEISSKIIAKNLSLNETTDSFILRTEVSNLKMDLLPNMFVEAKIFYPQTKEILIPFNSSIRMPNGMLAVFKVKTDETVEITFFKEKGIHNQNWIVGEGLNEGETIVYNSIQKMRNGMKIKPQKIDLK
jgi:membrane fusion protein (multidrug efflux system)